MYIFVLLGNLNKPEGLITILGVLGLGISFLSCFNDFFQTFEQNEKNGHVIIMKKVNSTLFFLYVHKFRF